MNQHNITVKVVDYITIGHLAPHYEMYIPDNTYPKAVRCPDTLEVGKTYTGTLTYPDTIVELVEFTPDF